MSGLFLRLTSETDSSLPLECGAMVEAVLRATKEGNLGELRRLCSLGADICTRGLVSDAVLGGHYEMLLYLHQQGANIFERKK